MAMRPRYPFALINQSLYLERLRLPGFEGDTPHYSLAGFRIISNAQLDSDSRSVGVLI